MLSLLTIALAAALAWLGARVLRPTPLPPVVGMVIGGVAAGALVYGPAAGIQLPLASWDLPTLSRGARLAVLAVVLLRAGLALSRADLRRGGPLALRLGLLPMLGDAAAVAAAGYLLLDLSWPVALVLGFTVAAISPAIVIPGLLDMMKGRHRALPSLLAGAPLDNIASVVALGLALSFALGENVDAAGVTRGAAVEVLGGIALGVVGGAWAALGLGRRGAPPRISGIAVWILAVALVWTAERFGLSSVLAIVTAGVVLRALSANGLDALERGLSWIWSGAQCVLFGLIGLSLDLAPLRDAGVMLVVVIGVGQAGRLVAALAATSTDRLPLRDRLACAGAYVPKATIQAAFGSLALDRGLAEGDLILTAAVLSIVLCAPVGTLTLQWAGKVLVGDGAQARPGANQGRVP